jgi:hypothetical protein
MFLTGPPLYPSAVEVTKIPAAAKSPNRLNRVMTASFW